MAYTQALGRQFWLDFDQYFKFESGQNGLGEKYNEMGGYNRPGMEWHSIITGGSYPEDFHTYVDGVRDPVLFLANEQSEFIKRYFGSDTEQVARAFQDFAFGILASPNAPNRQNEPVHTMNGGLFARDYLSWHGFIEAAIHLLSSDPFWVNLRWINGMGWELQAKARPQEVFPNQNEPLPDAAIKTIREKWEARTDDQIAEEFKHYDERPVEWLQAQ